MSANCIPSELVVCRAVTRPLFFHTGVARARLKLCSTLYLEFAHLILGAGLIVMEPSPRFGHCSALVEEKFCVWGGRTKDFLERKSELASSVHSFDQFLEFWAEPEDESSGIPPPGLYDGACASAGHHVYVYGGYDGSKYQRSLHKLDTRSWTWKQLSSAGPMRKGGCGMVAHDSKLVLFGGFGVPSGPTQPGAEFVKNSKYTSGEGWTNELYVFDLNKGMGECILLSILQHTLHGIECLHASFCHRNSGHFGAQLQCLQPYTDSSAFLNCKKKGMHDTQSCGVHMETNMVCSTHSLVPIYAHHLCAIHTSVFTVYNSTTKK